jgi:hypothetical protein
MTQTQCRKLNNSIERVIGPPPGYKERVKREVFPEMLGRRFEECRGDEHRRCQRVSGRWFCDCRCHNK